MAENKKTKEKKDKVFTLSGLIKEFKRIRWAKLKSTNEETGVIANSVSTFMFMAFFAAVLSGFDVLMALFTRLISSLG